MLRTLTEVVNKEIGFVTFTLIPSSQIPPTSLPSISHPPTCSFQNPDGNKPTHETKKPPNQKLRRNFFWHCLFLQNHRKKKSGERNTFKVQSTIIPFFSSFRLLHQISTKCSASAINTIRFSRILNYFFGIFFLS